MLTPIFADCPPCPPTCLMCGGDKTQQSGYCDEIARRASAYSPYSPTQQEKTREQMRADADERMEAARVAAVASITPSASSGASSGTSGSSTAEPKATPRRKKRPATKRTSAQVQRAAEQEKRESEYRTRMASPEWLRAQLDVEADFVASLREEAP